MAVNRLIQFKLNPTKFTLMNPAVIPQYVSKFYDWYLMSETIKDWEEPVNYCQPWLQSDAVRNMFVSNYEPITVFVVDGVTHQKIDGGTTLLTKQQDFYNPGYYYRLMDLDMADYPEGFYYFQLEVGSGPDVWISEPFVIGSPFKNTLLLEYSNYEAKNGLIFFQTNGVQIFSPSLRIPGRLKYVSTKSVDTLYFDEERNAEMLKSVDYDLYKLSLGGSPGAPPWLAKKVARIMNCSDVKCDGLLIAKATEGGDWEINEFDKDYPMNAYTLDVVEKLNDGTLVYDSGVEQVGINNMMAVVETKGFGMEDAGGNFLEINSTE